jgi:hypothetical protein
MKPKMNTTPRSLIALMAMVFLFSFSLPSAAGQTKRSSKQHEQTVPHAGDSDRLSLPGPVVDESPINPVGKNKDNSSGKSQQRRGDREPQKKRPRR